MLYHYLETVSRCPRSSEYILKYISYVFLFYFEYSSLMFRYVTEHSTDVQTCHRT